MGRTLLWFLCLFLACVDQTVVDYTVNLPSPWAVAHDRDFDIDPYWHPAGERIVYTAATSTQTRINEIKADGSGKRELFSASHRLATPCYSPNGEYLFFSSDQKGSFDLWRYHLSSDELLQITHSPEDEIYPRPSPDGRFVACIRAGNIVLLSPYGAPLGAWSDSTVRVESLCWDSGGEAIYFSGEKDGEWALYRYDLESGRIVPLGLQGRFPTCGRPRGASGDLLAYEAGGRLFVFSVAKSESRPVLTGGARPAWAPDAAHLAFERDGDIYLALIRVPVDG